MRSKRPAFSKTILLAGFIVLVIHQTGFCEPRVLSLRELAENFEPYRPKNVADLRVHRLMVIYHALLDNPNEAIAVCDSALQVAPRSIDFTVLKSSLLINTGQSNLALPYIQALATSSPQRSEMLQSLASAELDTQNLSAVHRTLEASVQKDSSDLLTWFQLGLVRRKTEVANRADTGFARSDSAFFRSAKLSQEPFSR